MFRADGSPIVNSYLRFNVSGLSGTVTSVHLLIFAMSSLSSGLKTQAVSDNTWGETTMTFNNAPALGGVLASAGAIATSTWVSFDVTGYISANGTYSFGITDSNATAISLASRESGANAPQLVITSQ
jgi:acid phosphatase type 7